MVSVLRGENSGLVTGVAPSGQSFADTAFGTGTCTISGCTAYGVNVTLSNIIGGVKPITCLIDSTNVVNNINIINPSTDEVHQDDDNTDDQQL